MSPSLSLPKQLIDAFWAFVRPPPDGLSTELRKQLNKRPSKPFRGISAHLVSIFLTKPYAALLLLQQIAPLLQQLTDFGPAVVYSKNRDVRDILDRDDDFPSGPTIGPGLVCGDFVLGMDRGPLHRSDLAMLWEALYHIKPSKQLLTNGPGPGSEEVEKELDRVGWFLHLEDAVVGPITRKVDRVINRHRGKRLDLVQDVFRPVCVEIVVQKYFGIGPPSKEWTDVVWDVLHSVAIGIALPYSALLTNKTDPVIREVNWAKDALNIAMDQAIDTAWKYRKSRENLIERLHALVNRNWSQLTSLPDDPIRVAIRRNVAGIAIAGCPPIAKAAAQAVDALLARPLAFEGASKAAKNALAAKRTLRDLHLSAAKKNELDKAEEEWKRRKEFFWQFIYEALRFYPAFPLVTRACVRDTSTGARQGNRRQLHAGQTVVVGLLPAMFDEDAVPFPQQFRTDRAPGDSLVFGRGLHACFGFQFAREVLVAMLLPLFAHGFRRLPGREGKLHFDLLAAKSLVVRMGPYPPTLYERLTTFIDWLRSRRTQRA